MNIKCIVVDDEPLARKGLQEYISQLDFLILAGVFEDAHQLFPVLNEIEADLIFLDIEMPKLSGVDFLKSLKNPPLVIFTTAYPSYAIEGFDLDVVDYLVKPIALPRFLKAANKAREILSMKKSVSNTGAGSNDYFFVKENGKYTKLFYHEVAYVEALQNYVAIHLGSKKLISYMTISMLETQLPAEKFMRIHKSYIASLDKITSIAGNTVAINSTTLPVSRKTRERLMEKVMQNKLLKR